MPKNNKEIYIVTSDASYYPFVNEHKTLEEAEKDFDSSYGCADESLYLCKVIKMRTKREVLTEME